MWDDLELGIERYGLQFYQQLNAAHDIRLKAVGMVRLAVTPKGAQLQADQYARARSMVATNELELLSPDQVGNGSPWSNPHESIQAYFGPRRFKLILQCSSCHRARTGCRGRGGAHRGCGHRYRGYEGACARGADLGWDYRHLCSGQRGRSLAAPDWSDGRGRAADHTLTRHTVRDRANPSPRELARSSS